MSKDISDLYKGFILERNNSDVGFEKRANAEHIIDAYNPLCGDKFKLYLDIEADIISKLTFHGYGCAISKAATSALVEKIQGKTVKEALYLIKNYFKLLDINNQAQKDIDKDLVAFEVVKNFPERMTCATLSWQAVGEFLEAPH